MWYIDQQSSRVSFQMTSTSYSQNGTIRQWKSSRPKIVSYLSSRFHRGPPCGSAHCLDVSTWQSDVFDGLRFDMESCTELRPVYYIWQCWWPQNYELWTGISRDLEVYNMHGPKVSPLDAQNWWRHVKAVRQGTRGGYEFGDRQPFQPCQVRRLGSFENPDRVEPSSYCESRKMMSSRTKSSMKLQSGLSFVSMFNAHHNLSFSCDLASAYPCR